MNINDNYDWSFEKDAVEVKLATPDDFLKIKETLTRMGVPALKDKKLFQSCHILHKKGKYYILHFKELFLLDGKPSNFDDSDRKRRNLITQFLEDWGLLEIVDRGLTKDKISLNKIRILSFKEKDNWKLETKYSIGNG